MTVKKFYNIGAIDLYH